MLLVEVVVGLVKLLLINEDEQVKLTNDVLPRALLLNVCIWVIAFLQ